MSEPNGVEDELETLFAKAGLTIPEDRKQAILGGYIEVRAMADLLRTMDLEPIHEPANIYGFDPVLRGMAS